MFSATWPQAVHQLAQEFMDPNPVKVIIVTFIGHTHSKFDYIKVFADKCTYMSCNLRLLNLAIYTGCCRIRGLSC